MLGAPWGLAHVRKQKDVPKIGAGSSRDLSSNFHYFFSSSLANHRLFFLMMPPSTYTRAAKVVCGVGAVAIGIYLGYENRHRTTLRASWTTNFKPSVEWDWNWDRREPSSLVKPPKTEDEKDSNEYNVKLEGVKSKANRHLIFIRHGQYDMSPKSDEGRKLTGLGKEQATFTGKRLQELSKELGDFDLIMQSTMTRAMETAQIISGFLPKVPLQSCALLREGAPIPPEPPIGHWRPEPSQFYEDGARIEAAFRKYVHRADTEQTVDSYEVFVCHANVIRYFVCRALQFPPEAWLRISLNHGSITWLTVRPNGRVVLKALGDSGHIPVDKLTTS
ncbi:serine/threonine-protein phosphatase PGAM5, mitochondrial-like isoform X1 [Branchiostoma floridae x Branchiostoma belcheri]